MSKPDLKKECIRLRIEERKSYKEIRELTGASRGSLSLWLRAFPLSKKEQESKAKSKKRKYTRKIDSLEKSKYIENIKINDFSRARKGIVSEAAIQFRLALHGFEIYSSTFSGDKFDFLVSLPKTKKIITLQVKTCKRYKRGLPVVTLKCKQGFEGYRRYKKEEFDFIVGYDIYSDTAYVFSSKEAEANKAAISTSLSSKEKWDKLLNLDIT